MGQGQQVVMCLADQSMAPLHVLVLLEYAPLEKVCPWRVARVIFSREDPPLLVGKNFKS